MAVEQPVFNPYSIKLIKASKESNALKTRFLSTRLDGVVSYDGGRRLAIVELKTLWSKNRRAEKLPRYNHVRQALLGAFMFHMSTGMPASKVLLVYALPNTNRVSIFDIDPNDMRNKTIADFKKTFAKTTTTCPFNDGVLYMKESTNNVNTDLSGVLGKGEAGEYFNISFTGSSRLKKRAVKLSY